MMSTGAHHHLETISKTGKGQSMQTFVYKDAQLDLLWSCQLVEQYGDMLVS